MSEAGATAYEDAQWRRLDKRMLAIHPVQEAVRFLPALLAVFLTGRNSERDPWWDWAALALVVAFGVSQWFTTRYRIWNGQIELRKGLLRRTVLATPADRVRTVDVSAPIWHRLLGVARVEVGTAGGAGSERIVLDALAAPEAERLRGELLHRRGWPPATTGPCEAPDPARPEPGSPPEPTPQAEQLLLRLDPSWVRFAPLTTSGMVSALAIWGFGMQYLGGQWDRVESALAAVEALGATLAVVLGLLTALVVVSILAVTAYVLSFWDFRLSRHAGGTLHTRRGLLTTRATSIEEARLRGVELGEPLGLRLAGAARLHAVTTGLRHREVAEGSAWLSPPAPAVVVERTAQAVVGDEQAVAGPLLAHGRGARRRRFTRAVGSCAVLAGIALLGWWRLGLAVPLVVAGCVPLLLAPWLAADRYAALGHLLTARHLVVRAGSLSRRRDVLAREGVIGVVVRESFFQRRAGVATLTATTAAGKQGYAALDLPREQAIELSLALLPATVGQFVEGRAEGR